MTENEIIGKGIASYHLCFECFSQFSFDSEMYTKSTADLLYISESNENWEKYFNREMIQPLVDFVRCSDYKFLEIIS